MTVTDIMTTEVITIGLDDTLGEMQKIWVCPDLSTLFQPIITTDWMLQQKINLCENGPIQLVGAQVDFSAGLKLEFAYQNIMCKIYINSAQKNNPNKQWKNNKLHRFGQLRDPDIAKNI